MANINENYLNLQGSYLFANIAKKLQIIRQLIQMQISFVLVSAMLHYHLFQQLSML